ncbi:hypothetical protein WJX74_005421 [Apatococcus lobatus]|uniref:Glycosyltransferase 61 catalytic domain-containing protein n=1 Tax=Apatococcus lobatus TaxID=904363 RepID=A0AAW1SG88_9CHLO
MTACFQLPEDPILDYMKPPLIAVMNRPAGHRRSIHNGAELAAHLQQGFKDQGAIVQHIRFDEGMSIRDQAIQFSKIAILIQVHGAGLANAIFLPRGAVVIDIMQQGFYERIAWSMRTVRDYKNVQLGYIPLAEQQTLLLPIATESPDFQALTHEEQHQVEQMQCPRLELKKQCDHWWWYGSAVIVDGFQAVQVVWMAMHQIGRGTL